MTAPKVDKAFETTAAGSVFVGLEADVEPVAKPAEPAPAPKL